MAQPRTELQEILEDFEGVNEAWFQKPLNTKLVEPYIVYELDNEEVKRADNGIYAFWNRYTVTVVVRDPDSPIPGFVRALDHCRFSRKFISAGLYHFVYDLYF